MILVHDHFSDVAVIQVFTVDALRQLEKLAKVKNDFVGTQPKMMPLKPWPADERGRTLKGIMKLNYLNEEHKAEWQTWFDQLTEVSNLAVFLFVMYANMFSVILGC